MGHTALDYIITVDEFPKANNSAPMKTMKNLNGGAAANVAMIGATLGMKTGLVSAVGCEFIDSHYHKNMQKLGVDTEALIISQERGEYSNSICHYKQQSRSNQLFLLGCRKGVS